MRFLLAGRRGPLQALTLPGSLPFPGWLTLLPSKLTTSYPPFSPQASPDSAPIWGFPGGSDSKDSACNAGDVGSIPGSGRSSGKGNGNPLQDFGLENSKDRRAWQATIHGVAKSQT